MWEAASDPTSFSLSLFCFSEGAELLPDNKASSSRANTQAVKYSREMRSELECVFNPTSVGAKQRVSAARLQEFEELLLNV